MILAPVINDGFPGESQIYGIFFSILIMRLLIAGAANYMLKAERSLLNLPLQKY
jgi:hypothetical protein